MLLFALYQEKQITLSSSFYFIFLWSLFNIQEEVSYATLLQSTLSATVPTAEPTVPSIGQWAMSRCYTWTSLLDLCSWNPQPHRGRVLTTESHSDDELSLSTHVCTVYSCIEDVSSVSNKKFHPVCLFSQGPVFASDVPRAVGETFTTAQFYTAVLRSMHVGARAFEVTCLFCLQAVFLSLLRIAIDQLQIKLSGRGNRNSVACFTKQR